MHSVDKPEIPLEVLEALQRLALPLQADLNQFDSAFQQRLADAADGPEFALLLEQYCLERFDLCAASFPWLALSQNPGAINPEYERRLHIMEEKSLRFLTEVLESTRADIREDIRTRVALKLSARILGLLAEARHNHCERYPPPNVETLRLRVASAAALVPQDLIKVDAADGVANQSESTSSAPPVPTVTPPPPMDRLLSVQQAAQRHETFKQAADGLWEVSYGAERRVGLKNVTGMALIRALLATPGRAFHASEFVVDGVVDVNERQVTDEFHEAGLNTTSQFGGDLTLDPQALRAYQKELRQLNQQLTEAEARSDEGESARLGNEIEAIKAQLRADVGLHGRARHVGSDVERARKAATGRYRTAIKMLRQSLPDLSDHLRQCISAGAEFVYRPDKAITWMT